jgi:hypothetical protein
MFNHDNDPTNDTTQPHAIELTPSLVNMLTHEAASFFYVCHYLSAVLSRKQPRASVPAPLLLLVMSAARRS